MLSMRRARKPNSRVLPLHNRPQDELPGRTEANLITFDQKVAAADAAAINILATLRFASPKLQEEFRSTLSQLLAKDFKEANSGKWTGDVALGMAIGMFLS